MTGWWFEIITMAVAVNGAGAALAARSTGGERISQGVLAAIIGGGVLMLAALVGDSVVDGLDVEPESFRTAAGIVMAVQGARMAWDPASTYRSGDGIRFAIVPLGWPVIGNAAAIMAAIGFSADGPDSRIFAASVLAAAVAGAAIAQPFGRDNVAPGLARALGAVLIAMAAALVVSGVRDV
ncbi:MAG TPA: MarC family protein [Dehalococcoidia bacterium]|nr:MarC family protein [Dehalococcoidia bacterium]